MPIRKSKVITRLATVVTATAMVVPLMSVVGASSANANANRTPNQAAFPHSDTLYTSGTAYSPPTNFNPNDPGALYTGTNGLLYESLFLYDPIHNKYIPWLATSGTWSGDTYTIHVRNGVDWVSSPSQSVVGTLTGADVVFTINMEKADAAAAFNSNMSSVKSATANGNTVTVTFNGTPDYTAWQEFLWKGAIFPQSVFASETPAEQVTGNNATPVSTGPMTLDTTSATQACFQTNPHWWGTAAARALVQVQVPLRLGERLQQRRTVGAAQQRPRLEQQLPAGHQHPEGHRWRQLPARPTTPSPPTCFRPTPPGSSRTPPRPR